MDPANPVITGPTGQHPPRTDGWSGRARTFVLMAATLAGVYVCYRLMLPFVPAFAWALTFGVLFAPMHRWFETRLHRPNTAALLSVITVILILVVPAILVGGRLLTEAERGAASVAATLESGEWQGSIENYPRVAPLVHWLSRHVNVPGLIDGTISRLTDASAALVRGSVTQVAVFLLTFYFLFYFFRDRHAAALSLLRYSPLSRDEMALVTSRVEDTIHATFYGTIVCAAVQGALGGLAFWWLGLASPVLWGVIMGLLAIVPVFGAWLVWVPAATLLALDGRWGQAAILTVWGGIVIGWIDNLIYPMLVGSRLRLHTVPTFVSIVGGLTVFGVSGVILGPLAAAITLALLQVWQARSRAQARGQTPPAEITPAGDALLL